MAVWINLNISVPQIILCFYIYIYLISLYQCSNSRASIIEENPSIILNELNKIDLSIQFTIECEHDNKLNYPDVTIIKVDNGKFNTTIYRKLNKRAEIIHYNAKTPFQYKLAAVRSYINHAIMICSNEKLLKQEMEFIIDEATKAGYKNYLVWNLYKKQIKKAKPYWKNAEKQKNFYKRNPI